MTPRTDQCRIDNKEIAIYLIITQCFNYDILYNSISISKPIFRWGIQVVIICNDADYFEITWIVATFVKSMVKS